MSIPKKRAVQAMFIAGAWILFLVPGAFAQKQDLIFRKDSSKPLSVDKVISETYTEVKYKKGSRENKISSDKVSHINYYDVPEAYQNGLSLAGKGEFENALNSFKLAMEDKGVRSWIKTYSLIEIGKLYQQWGLSSKDKLVEAVKTYEKLLEGNPETRFYPEVLLNMGISQADNGDLAGAIETLDRLAQEAYDKKLGTIWEAKARFEKANAQLKCKSLDEAGRGFSSAKKFASDQAKSAEKELSDELLKMCGKATIIQGSIMIEKNNLREAQNFFEGIIKDETSGRDIKAGAECGLGKCLMADKNLKEAQIQFARAKVLYGDITDAGAQATYYLGLLCLEMKEDEPNSKKKAQSYFKELIEWYPGTDWAKQARTKID